MSSNSISDASPHHRHHNHSHHQGQNGFIGKPDVVMNGTSHDMSTSSISGSSNDSGRDLGSSDGNTSGDNFAVFDENLLVEDPFYNFGDLGQSSDAMQMMLDPSNPDSIPFSDIPFQGQEFDPELFNSILSTGDDILASLDGQPASGRQGSVGVLDVREGEDDRSGSATPTNGPQPTDPFDDFARTRVLSTIVEDHTELQQSTESDYFLLDNIQTIMAVNSPPVMNPHPLQPHPLPAKPLSFASAPQLFQSDELSGSDTSVVDTPSTSVEPGGSREALPKAPPRTVSLRSSSFTSADIVGSPSPDQSKWRQGQGGDEVGVVDTPVYRSRHSVVHISSNGPTTPSSPPDKGHPLNRGQAEDPWVVPTQGTSDTGREGGDYLESSANEGVATSEVQNMEVISVSNNSEPHSNAASSSSPESPGSGSNPASSSCSNPALGVAGGDESSKDVTQAVSAPNLSTVMSSPSETPCQQSSTPSQQNSTPNQQNSTPSHASSPSSPSRPLETSLDTGLRQSPRLGHKSPKSVRRTNSSADTSPILRPKMLQTQERRPSSEFVVLEPLSPEHGQELNQQYEFLRRTLSHSQRRYSQRGRRPQQKKPRKDGAGDSSRESGLVRNQIEPGSRGENLNREVRQRQAVNQLQSIVRESETLSSSSSPQGQRRGQGAGQDNMEERVDQHGRVYYMNHITRTIAFDRGGGGGTMAAAPTQGDIQTRREMLDRRYQSLQRSFRRTERPNVHVRNRTVVGNHEHGGLAERHQQRTENNSLSLSLAEAEEMARNLSSHGRSKQKKERTSSKAGRWFRRSKSKSITQQATSSTSGDDIIPVSPTSLSAEGSPQPENAVEAPSQSSVSDSSSRGNTVTATENGGGENAVTSLDASAGRSPSFERELTPSSILSAEFESGTEDERSLRQVQSPTHSAGRRSASSDISDEVIVTVANSTGETSTSTAESAATGLRDRQSSIVHGSHLSHADRTAAARARSKSKRRQRLDTDELTNITSLREGIAEVETSSNQSPSSEPPSSEPPSRGQREEEEEEEEVVKEKPAPSSGMSRGSIRKSKRSPKTLATSPALRFIVRKDLYSFLSGAGTAGEEFFSNRALMELVQRIRSNNSLFQKYEHSHHLVEALNRFSDKHAELPKGWEKKLNKQGKIFFIDHKNELTTFLDPRLPFPDTPYTFVGEVSKEGVSRMTSMPLEVRPHLTTVMRHSQSLDIDITPASPTSNPDQSATPTPSTPTPSTPTHTPTTPTPSTPTPSGSGGGGGLSTSTVLSNRMSVLSVDVMPLTYEEQVVAFFRQPNVTDLISQRYARGVRPPLQAMINAIRVNGTSTLERIQMSGGVASYELALVLSLFEEEIGQMREQPPEELAAVAPPVLETSQSLTESDNSLPMSGKSTLQRRKEAFPTKLQNFKMMMARLGYVQGSRIRYNIRRDHLLEDTYEHVMKTDAKLLQKKRLNITFKGEEGLDYGGPSREFFFLLSREIFNPYYGLFDYSANDTYTIQISSTAAFIQNNLDWFRFAGRVVALVVVQGFLLDVFFTRTVYKSLLCRPSSLKDLEALEPDFYNSLVWICDNDPEPLDLTFTVEEEAFGQLQTHELKRGGTDIPVTEDNKDEYVDMMVKWRLDRGVAKQMNAFKKGFAEVLSVHLLVNFDAQELEFLTAGTLEIDVDDWKANTEYRNGYHALHQVVLWFWKVVESFDNEERLRLLQFVTGTSSVPIAGFKALRGSNGPKKFTIDYFNDVQSFPRTHTCFNRIDLPPYPSYDVLDNKLRFAITEGGGFGIE